MSLAPMLDKIRHFTMRDMAKHESIKKIVVISLILIFVIVFCDPGNFAVSSYPCIKKEDIHAHLQPNPNSSKYSSKLNIPICSLPDTVNDVMLYPNATVPLSVFHQLPEILSVKPGGYWKPDHCIARYQIVIIVPYRNREEQLRIFLSFMHPFLQKQMLEYRIVVVEQVPNAPFNRAKLFNVGYTEALKFGSLHCIIFHDVDLLPQKLSNIYACTKEPRHMSSSLNTFRYVLPYKNLFGGAIAITKEQFELVNGFSNVFFGWGGEDDDFYSRISSHGLSICRFEPAVARYIMLPHKKEPPSENRLARLKAGNERFSIDGLSNLKYVIVDSKQEKLYSWFLVNV